MNTRAPGSVVRAVAIGLLVGVLIFAVGAAGVVAVDHLGGDDGGGGRPSSQASATTTSPTATPSGRAAALPSTPPALDRFYQQKVAWHACGSNRCGQVRVPLDYARPDGAAIGLAVLKVPARDQAHKVGDLVVNPGGPGASGVDYARAGSLVFGEQLRKYFDIVGFDPRGVGRSDPLRCLGTQGLDQVLAYDPDPDTGAERARIDQLVRGFGRACLRRSGELTRHISTPEAARDVDVIRAVLGQPRLDWFGASYGTFLGATYADLFPRHVGRMVLDGAIDPSLSNEQLSLAQAHGFEVALRAYVADCVKQGGCVLGDSVAAGTRRIRGFLDQVERKPLQTSLGRPLQIGNAVTGIWMPLYVQRYWPLLTQALTAASQQHDGTQLLNLSDQYNSRGPDRYNDNSVNALYDVNCLDHDDSIPTAQVPAHYAAFEKASPTFGRAFAYSLSVCSVWPVHTGRRTHALHAKGAAPILVVGTTRDPATPLAWARSLARQLSSGVLLTRDGDGHTGFQQGNPCVDSKVEQYLINGRVPRDHTRC